MCSSQLSPVLVLVVCGGSDWLTGPGTPVDFDEDGNREDAASVQTYPEARD